MADTRTGSGDTFSAAERAAMKERAAELKAQATGGKGAAKREREAQALIDALEALPQPDRTLATRFHDIVRSEAPDLAPRTWYGMPAYAKDDKVLTFLQPASKFDTRYSTIGFNDVAALDDGEMWPASFAVLEITDDVEQRLRALVRRAVGG